MDNTRETRFVTITLPVDAGERFEWTVDGYQHIFYAPPGKRKGDEYEFSFIREVSATRVEQLMALLGSSVCLLITLLVIRLLHVPHKDAPQQWAGLWPVDANGREAACRLPVTATRQTLHQQQTCKGVGKDAA